MHRLRKAAPIDTDDTIKLNFPKASLTQTEGKISAFSFLGGTLTVWNWAISCHFLFQCCQENTVHFVKSQPPVLSSFWIITQQFRSLTFVSRPAFANSSRLLQIHVSETIYSDSYSQHRVVKWSWWDNIIRTKKILCCWSSVLFCEKHKWMHIKKVVLACISTDMSTSARSTHSPDYYKGATML